MKKNQRLYFPLLLTLFLASNRLLAQPVQYDAKFVDSITSQLPKLPDDTSKVNNLVRLAGMYLFINPTLTIKYAKEGAAIAKKIQYHTGRISCLGQSAFSYAISGDWVKATIDVNEAIPLCEKYKPQDMIYMCNLMVIISATKGDHEQALKWAQKASKLPGFSARTDIGKWPTYMQLGMINDALDRLDSAKYYADIVLGYVQKYASAEPGLTKDSYSLLGNIARKQKQFQQAIKYYRLAPNNTGLANVFHELKQSDSAIHYALDGLHEGQVQNNPSIIQSTAKVLAAEYKTSNPQESNKYLQLYVASKDSLFNAEKLKQLEELRLNEQRNEFELKIKETANRNRFMLSSLFVILASLTILVVLIWRNNRFKQKANQQLETSLNNLKTTQAQLIQSEKMASLGELTAGIAHEIQNPLNFVNNFSEVNNELIGELVDEVEKGNTEEVKLIAADIKENSQKINHHGKRADAIVKGMLQHSSRGSGKKEPTDINKLADEYLRLAYHGLRAKDKTFNATLITDYDETIGNIDIIPQDMGRVILNLITNAFYAASLPPPAVEGFSDAHYIHSPTIWVSTKKEDNKVLISVRDNGPGIPQKIRDKIFQPFFTTKPTGQGTGLGLSLSYDIVKAHGGELKVETAEGKGSEFIIQLNSF